MFPLLLAWTMCQTSSQVANNLKCHDAHVKWLQCALDHKPSRYHWQPTWEIPCHFASRWMRGSPEPRGRYTHTSIRGQGINLFPPWNRTLQMCTSCKIATTNFYHINDKFIRLVAYDCCCRPSVTYIKSNPQPLGNKNIYCANACVICQLKYKLERKMNKLVIRICLSYGYV